MMFYIAGAVTGLSSLLFLTLPNAKDDRRDNKIETSKASKASTEEKSVRFPSAFTLSCSCLGVLAVGMEAGLISVVLPVTQVTPSYISLDLMDWT